MNEKKTKLMCEFCQKYATLICTKDSMTYQGPDDGLTRPVLYPLCDWHYENSNLYTIVVDFQQVD